MSDSSRAPIYAWLMLALLMVASIVSFVDRQVVAIVVEPMKADLGISDSQIGWLYGVFAVFYAMAALPIAMLADRYTRKYIIAAGIFFWSIMTIACGLSRQFWHVLWARVGVGVGEASLGPATVSMVGDLFPKHQIPMALSVFQTAAVMGSGIAFIIGGFVLEVVESAAPLRLPVFGELQPWQQTFVYVGLPGLALAVLFLFVREPTRRNAPVQQFNTRALRQFYAQHRRVLLLHHFGFLSFALSGYAFVFWSVSYLVRVHGVDASQAAQQFGLIFLLSGPVGPVLAAFIARKLDQRGHKDANITAGMLCGLIAIPCVIAVALAPNVTWALILYVPAMLFVNGPYGLANGSLPIIAPSIIHAQVAAVYLFVVSIGNLLGPPIAGFFNESVFPEAQGVRYSIITVATVFGLLGVILLHLARQPYARAVMDAERA